MTGGLPDTAIMGRTGFGCMTLTTSVERSDQMNRTEVQGVANEDRTSVPLPDTLQFCCDFIPDELSGDRGSNTRVRSRRMRNEACEVAHKVPIITPTNHAIIHAPKEVDVFHCRPILAGQTERFQVSLFPKISSLKNIKRTKCPL
jgi:hypothetical protein